MEEVVASQKVKDLDVIKAEPKLADCELVKLSRLSVAEIKPDEWSVICSMAGI